MKKKFTVNWEVAKNQSFYAYIPADLLNRELISQLEQRGKSSATGRARYCLHEKPGDNVHIMLIYHDQRTKVPLHRHSPYGEYIISFQGDFRLVFQEDNGEKKIINISNSGGPYTCVVPPEKWHNLEFDGPTLFYEISEGSVDEKKTTFSD